MPMGLLADDCSWNRLEKYPDNLRVFQPLDPGYLEDTTWANSLARSIGGAWPVLSPGNGKTVRYYGDHTNGLDGAVADAIRADMLADMQARKAPKTSPDPDGKDRENRRARAALWKRENALRQVAGENPVAELRSR